MLNSLPVIFISAVSKELYSTHDFIARPLISMGYAPI